MRIKTLSLFVVLLWFGNTLAWSDASHTKAKKLGSADFSLMCPSGAKWSPKDGGVCRGCANGEKPKWGKCKKIIPEKKSKASYSHKRWAVSPVCRIGTFKKKGTRECWRCPKGYKRNKGAKVTATDACKKRAKTIKVAPAIVSKMPLEEILKPENISDNMRSMGCQSYGENAIFSSKQRGSCWQCPKTHPVRTYHSITSDEACATKACGGLGQRQCYKKERKKACDEGLKFNPFKGQCVAKKNLACKPVLKAVKGVRNTIIEAEKLGDSLTSKSDDIPGMAAIRAITGEVEEKLQETIKSAVDSMAMDDVLKNMNMTFNAPEKIEVVRHVVLNMNKNIDKLNDNLMNADIACDMNNKKMSNVFLGLIEDALKNITPPKAYMVGTNNSTFSLTDGDNRPTWFHQFMDGAGFSLSSGFVFNSKPKLVVSFSFYARFNRDGTTDIGLNFSPGINNPTKTKDLAIGAAPTFLSLLLPKPEKEKACDPVFTWVEAHNLIGVKRNCQGYRAITFRLDTRKFEIDNESQAPQGLSAAMSDLSTPADLAAILTGSKLDGNMNVSRAERAKTFVVGARLGMRMLGKGGVSE